MDSLADSIGRSASFHGRRSDPTQLSALHCGCGRDVPNRVAGTTRNFGCSFFGCSVRELSLFERKSTCLPSKLTDNIGRCIVMSCLSHLVIVSSYFVCHNVPYSV